METQQPDKGLDSPDEKSDLRVVMQFFIVPLVLVLILVLFFFGLQIMRSRDPDVQATLRSLRSYDGFLSGVIGDLKRWQYGYDLSLLLRADVGEIDPGLVPDLIVALNETASDDDLKLRRYLTLALGQAADPRGVAPLAEALQDDDDQTRLFAAWGLMRAGGDGAAEALRAAAGDPDRGVRKMAVFALGELEDEGAVPLLREALTDSEIDVGWNAALSLARLGDREAVPVLLEMLDLTGEGVGEGDLASAADGGPALNASPEDPRGVRILNAIRGLALLRAPEAVEPLQRISGAPAVDPAIAAAARLALESCSGVPQAAIP